MSTKATISRDDDHHLYEEAFDEEFIYLQLDKSVEYKVRHNFYGRTHEKQLVVTIPHDVWREIIRGYVQKYGDDLQLGTLRFTLR